MLHFIYSCFCNIYICICFGLDSCSAVLEVVEALGARPGGGSRRHALKVLPGPCPFLNLHLVSPEVQSPGHATHRRDGLTHTSSELSGPGPCLHAMRSQPSSTCSLVLMSGLPQAQGNSALKPWSKASLSSMTAGLSQWKKATRAHEVSSGVVTGCSCCEKLHS
jgi:hypothetical protein